MASAEGQAYSGPAGELLAAEYAGTAEPVPVVQRPADEAVYATLVLAPGAARQLLPQDPARVRALVLAVDNAVVLCATKELAQAAANQVNNVPYPAGMYLPVATVPTELRSTGLVWAANTSTTASSRISICTERNAA